MKLPHPQSAIPALGLKHLRKILGLTQAQLAARLGKHFRSVQEWENGTRSRLPKEIAIQLQVEYGIDAQSLYSQDGICKMVGGERATKIAVVGFQKLKIPAEHAFIIGERLGWEIRVATMAAVQQHKGVQFLLEMERTLRDLCERLEFNPQEIAEGERSNIVSRKMRLREIDAELRPLLDSTNAPDLVDETSEYKWAKFKKRIHPDEDVFVETEDSRDHFRQLRVFSWTDSQQQEQGVSLRYFADPYTRHYKVRRGKSKEFQLAAPLFPISTHSVSEISPLANPSGS